MAHLRVRRGPDSFSAPSEANRDLGIFLVFTGVVAAVPLYYLFRVLVMHTSVWDWRKGAALGLLLALAGLYLIAFTRRRFRARDGSVYVSDGLFRRPVRYSWEGQPRIRLQSLERDRGGRPLECWQVMLLDGKYEYLLDNRPEQHLESRALAEFLAKTLDCPLIVRHDQGETQIEAADLDLPFEERVHKYPHLLGPRLERPEPFPIVEEGSGSERAYRWGMMTSGMLTETVGLFLVALAISVVPLPGGESELDYSLFELARIHQDYKYFYATGGLFLAAMILLFGYRVHLELKRDQVCACTKLWGVPLWARSIPRRVLEEISTRGRSQGAFLQLVSDERIINLRILRHDLAQYLAAELRHLVAGDVPVAKEAPAPVAPL